MRERDQWGDRDVDGDNIKIDLRELGWACGNWIELAQYRYRWRALVSKVMNIRIPKMRGIS